MTPEGAAAPIDTAWHGGFNSFALSPDGRRLAVGVGLASGTLGIWIKQLDRGPFTRLTFGGQDRRPVWSPDGQVVAFVRDSLNGSSIFARRADGEHAGPAARAARPPGPGGRPGRRTAAGSCSAPTTAAAGAGDLVGVRTSGTRRRCRWWRASSPSCTRPSRPTAAGSPTRRRVGRERGLRPAVPGHDGRAVAGVERRRHAAALVARRPGAVLPATHGPPDRASDRRVEHGVRGGRTPAAVRRVRLRDRPLPYLVRGDWRAGAVPLPAPAAAGPDGGASPRWWRRRTGSRMCGGSWRGRRDAA